MSFTRRQFLQSAAGGSAVVALASPLPAFWNRAALVSREIRGESILVVVQLSGGNDGLNTIVPFTDDRYYSARPKLAISRDRVLKIDDELGLHPSLNGFAELLERQRLAIVQGVGYPDPNRSHFESMDIWHTCRRKNERREAGWLGQYLDASSQRAGGDSPAIHFGAEKQPLALAARDIRTPSIGSLERFRLQAGGRKDLEAAIGEITRVQRSTDNDLLTFVQSSTTSALAASRRVGEALKSYTPAVDYPAHELGEKLKIIAQLIDSGLQTRIYYVTLDGFDTHSQQPEAHAVLLSKLATAVAAFDADLRSHGHGERVLTFAFSEFGRRVEENASEGTDHGAAAPLFLAGPVKPGLHGAHPRLDDLVDGDPKFSIDFRQVYATLLENWLKWPSAEILGATYSPVAALAPRA